MDDDHPKPPCPDCQPMGKYTLCSRCIAALVDDEPTSRNDAPDPTLEDLDPRRLVTRDLGAVPEGGGC